MTISIVKFTDLNIYVANRMNGYVIGDNDMLTGFRLVGVEGVEVNTLEETQTALNEALNRTDIAVLIVSDVFSKEPSIREKIDKVRLERMNPLIVEVPSSKGTSNRTQLSDIISKILGITVR
ncbi:MAG: V-type ATP synthase subunit F [Candidatus Bathyarchaeia archaeon]